MIVAVPLRAPAVAVSMPTTSALLLLDCGASRLNEPAAVTPAVAPPIDALSFSEKPSLAARVGDRQRLRRGAADAHVAEVDRVGRGRARARQAKHVADRPITPVTPTDWLGSAVMPRPLVPAPSDAKLTVTAPLTLPAAAVFRPTTMLLALLDAGAEPADAAART